MKDNFRKIIPVISVALVIYFLILFYRETKRISNSEPLICPSDLSFFNQEDRQLYKRSWEKDFILERDLERQKDGSEKKFQPLENQLSQYKPILPAQKLGFEYLPYAGVTAGDINHDGYQDFVLSKINQKIRVYLNNKKSDFIDITACVFPNDIPENVEYVALADFNNDTWLDLLIFNSQYKRSKKNTIYFFDPVKKIYYDSNNYFGNGKKMVGGVGIFDLNKDKKLDFYVSFGLDWLSEATDFRKHPFKDEFWLSNKNDWQENFDNIFPKEAFSQNYAGMTALFTDFNLDGNIDFLLGNDFFDPSVTLLGDKSGKFQQVAKDLIEYNSYASMSYFPVDLDNDGQYELYEVGISNPPKDKKTEVSPSLKTDDLLGAELDKLNQEFIRLFQKKQDGKLICNQFFHPYVKSYCQDLKTYLSARSKYNRSACNPIVSDGIRAQCKREIRNIIRDDPEETNTKKFENFPSKSKKNAILKFNKITGIYEAVPENLEAFYTSFTWNAYPFDVNNDGLQDIYIATGFSISSRDINKLLINTSTKEKIKLTDQAKEYGVDLPDDTRGIIISDFDNDGDGDLVINNFFTPPKYFENMAGGDSLEVELRSKNSNYYALGAALKLVTNKYTQIREIRQGGHWDTAQPFIQHFGIAQDDQIKNLQIRWPNGQTQKFENLAKNKKYIIYE